MGSIFLLFSLLFFWRYWSYDPTKVNRGRFGGIVWWNNMRLVHSIAYLLFGILSTAGVQQAWSVLAIDVGLSFVVGTMRTFTDPFDTLTT